MIMDAIVRSVWVWASWILTWLVALFEHVHALVEEDLIGGVVEVLGLEGYVWDDVEIVDHTVDFGDF